MIVFNYELLSGGMYLFFESLKNEISYLSGLSTVQFTGLYLSSGF